MICPLISSNLSLQSTRFKLLTINSKCLRKESQCKKSTTTIGFKCNSARESTMDPKSNLDMSIPKCFYNMQRRHLTVIDNANLSSLSEIHRPRESHSTYSRDTNIDSMERLLSSMIIFCSTIRSTIAICIFLKNIGKIKSRLRITPRDIDQEVL